MTNEPSYAKQLVVQEYWSEVADYDYLPGSTLPVDRFARVNYYLNKVPKVAETHEALAISRSILETVTVPRHFALPDRPNISTTVYRSLFDHKNLRYYYQGTYTPHFCWISVGNFDFTEGSEVLMFDTEKGNKIISGDITGQFEESKPFEYLSDDRH